MDSCEMLEKFNALFTDSFIRVPDNDKGSHIFILTETDKCAKWQAIEIRGVPQNSILLKMHNYPPSDKVFKSTKGERKMCDYILLTSYKGDLYFIFIEMKSQNLDNRDIVPQFMGGDCFMTYCAAIAEKFHGARISSGLLRKRNIVFHTPFPLGKSPTRLNRKLQKTVRTAPSLSGPIVRIPCKIKNGMAFAFFEKLAFDMSEDIRDV